ncbi:BUD13 homolog [Helianthus annuus]|uniref:BUD13 homolog n=1 Tax=Helianthus annuus TaxID=4232 RepID=UPI0016530AD6|nr:BUD13 homolog [Helianthus annuus]
MVATLWLTPRFQSMDHSTSGPDAQGIRCDNRTGGRLSKEQIKSLQKQDVKPKEIKLEWGKGLAQKWEAEARVHELELEKAKPFARTKDDHDLNNMHKGKARWGDPMAH